MVIRVAITGKRYSEFSFKNDGILIFPKKWLMVANWEIFARI